MNFQLYNNIIYYIQYQKSPTEVVGISKQRKLRNYNKHYILKNNLLFKVFKDNYLKVIKDSEVEALLFMLYFHPLRGHLGIDKVVSKIKEKYYWP